jgi:hypothetical protein
LKITTSAQVYFLLHVTEPFYITTSLRAASNGSGALLKTWNFSMPYPIKPKEARLNGARLALRLIG